MIKGRLVDLQYEAGVVQGKADECAILLNDDCGIIKSIEQINAHHSHVINDHTSNTSGALLAQSKSSGIE